jgi:RNA polymerase-interacting CarD/CdnL/TRCF family regulator
MNFNTGDRVVHKNFGVGTVVSIESTNLSGDGQGRFYRVDFFKTSVWVPIDNQPEGGLRPITPKGHLDRYRAVLKSSPLSLGVGFHERRSELEKRMGRSTFQDLCEVYRDLNALNAKKPLNNYEKTLFKQTRESLVLEWSMTSGLSQTETIVDIDECFDHRK